jgi:hypothetical protein
MVISGPGREKMEMKGKIHRGFIEYSVTCKKCSNLHVDYRQTKKEYEKELLNDGWKRIRGYWVCDYCV